MALFNRFRAAVRTGPATEAGERIYAVGDIHGRLDLFQELVQCIKDHARDLPEAVSTHVVLLGDLVDRGPDSARLLEVLHDHQRRSDQLIVLKGNHEELMLRVINGEPGVMRSWLRVGGDATLRSYGIEPPQDAEQRAAAGRALARAVPAEILGWLRSLPLTARSGDYLFCHAGIRPGVAIKRQASNDLLWIREDFLNDDRDHGVTVVHGHSVTADVQIRPNRIGIDTGAYRTGVLTALYLEGAEREVISVGNQAPAGEGTAADATDVNPVR